MSDTSKILRIAFRNVEGGASAYTAAFCTWTSGKIKQNGKGSQGGCPFFVPLKGLTLL